jgi:hypothetical protein
VPVNRPSSSGFSQEAAAQANLRRSVALAADAQVFTDELAVVGLPRLVFWLFQTTAGNPATAVLQFNVRMIAGPAPEWLNIGPAFLLTPGVPQRIDLVMPCRAIRVGLTRVAGIATNIEVVLGGAASS